jgi:hypothetical protein
LSGFFVREDEADAIANQDGGSAFDSRQINFGAFHHRGRIETGVWDYVKENVA